MSDGIPERDWKVFRELRTQALDRLCKQILAQMTDEIHHPGRTAHEKYLNLYTLIQERDKDIALAFNDFRRSTAYQQIRVMIRMGLITKEEQERFTPETRSMLDF